MAAELGDTSFMTVQRMFATPPEIALTQMQAALAPDVTRGTVRADVAYGSNTAWRDALARLQRDDAVGIVSSVKVWPPGIAHHATHCIAAYGFREAERLRGTHQKKPSPRPKPVLSEDDRPRGAAVTSPAPCGRLNRDPARDDRGKALTCLKSATVGR